MFDMLKMLFWATFCLLNNVNKENGLGQPNGL